MQLDVSFKSIDGTSASLGIAGNKSVVADRRAGSAGGLGIGLSGGELQALALGAGYFNQLHFSAEELGLSIIDSEVVVSLDFTEVPLLVKQAEIRVRVRVATGTEDETRLLAHAQQESTISNAVARGFPVTISPQ